jgi:hypothetical protein
MGPKLPPSRAKVTIPVLYDQDSLPDDIVASTLDDRDEAISQA